MGENGRGERSVRTIAMLGNYLPRRCGIATFTTDLIGAIEREVPALRTFVLAMNDVGARHAYPSRVRFEIPEGELGAYRHAADFLHVQGADVLSVQHEYGIYGGAAGGHVLELLRDLRLPVVTTLHTILERPDAAQRAVLDGLLALSERVVVMSSDGGALLHKVHGLDPAKIDLIHHGIPQVAPRSEPTRGEPPALQEERFGMGGVDGGAVILTFGLLSPDKGIEHVIDAMPAILAKHPKTVYVVLGATHPHVKQHRGEEYRLMLQQRAERLGLAGNVIFDNRFVSHDELLVFVAAADLYVTPYLKEEQSTSGTLAYAVGCGKAVISTPYRYAREMLADGRGILVPWRDAEAIGREVIGLLDDPEKRRGFQQRAAEFGKSMGWPLVARRYVESFERARASFDDRRAAPAASSLPKRRSELPELDLAHLRHMTDDTGLLQHATFDIPRYRDGYCLDDNARALLLMTHVEQAGREPPHVVRALSTRYLAFVDHAFDEETGRFANFLSYERTFREAHGSDDSHGRALWALGAVIAHSRDPGRTALAARIFHRALPAVTTLGSPRAWAYSLLGIDAYLHAFEGDRHVAGVRAELAARLVERFRHSRSEDWPWFEDRLTYCNARLPQALWVSAARMGDAEMAAIAERSLAWLVSQQIGADGSFAPVGSNGFHVRGAARATFDQQPVEACGMVSACLDAYRLTQKTWWLDHARRAFQWFTGKNPLELPVYDARTGGCRDGIHADRLNENQGGESTLSFLTALAEMRAQERVAAKAVVTTNVSFAKTRAVSLATERAS